VGVLFNPIVYMSEGLRASVTPGITHMPWWAILIALVLFTRRWQGLDCAAFCGVLGRRFNLQFLASFFPYTSSK